MNNELSLIDLISEIHIGLKRQGSGSSEMTLKALSFVDNFENLSKVLDCGCGTGGQTMLITQNIKGSVTGIDLFQSFIDIFNDNVQKLNLERRVKGIVGSMEEIPFEKEEFDLIWSEGAIDAVGFEKCLAYWNAFLKKEGFVAVTCPSWLTNEHPDEVEKFWNEAGSSLDTIGNNINIMQKAGYSFVASFALPEICWIENYFIPREKASKELLKKYAGNKMAEDYIKGLDYEMELYKKYKKFYGYVFYLGKKYE